MTRRNEQTGKGAATAASAALRDGKKILRRLHLAQEEMADAIWQADSFIRKAMKASGSALTQRVRK